MARDYKPRQSGRSGSGLLFGIFIGFVLGVIVSAGVALYITKSPVPFLDRGRSDKTAPAGQNLKDVPKAAAKTPDGKPRFDFYRILPGQEEPVTSEQLKQAAQDKAAKKEGESQLNENYFLQAGAFQSPADADNMKAKLAFIGLESTVEPSNVPDKGVYYRVRLGPFNRIDDINRVRSQLAQNGIDASLVKIRDARTP